MEAGASAGVKLFSRLPLAGEWLGRRHVYTVVHEDSPEVVILTNKTLKNKTTLCM